MLGRAGRDGKGPFPGPLEKVCFRSSETRTFHRRAETVAISSNTTVDFVYNVLELHNVPHMQHGLISLFLNLYTSF